MKFDIKEWLKIYNEVKLLGQQLKDSYPFVDSKKKWHDPIISLTIHEQNELSDQIKILTRKITSYLNYCNVKFPNPLWNYDVKNKTTWISHQSFVYGHLMNGRKKEICRKEI